MIRRTQSNLSLREAFPPVMSYEIERFEEELGKIQNSVLLSNHRHLISIVGAVSLFLIVFFTTYRNLIYGLFATIVGCFIGYVIGKKIPGKVMRSSDLDKSIQYQLKLTCSLIYLNKLRTDKIEISDFTALLEKIIDDFRPALMSEGNLYEKQVKELQKLLKTNAVHVALLNSLIDLRHDIESEVLTHITGVRILRFYIPVLDLIKRSNHTKENELEVVKRIEVLLRQPRTKDILRKISVLDEETVKYIVPYTGFAPRLMANNALFCSKLADIENFMGMKRVQEPLHYDTWSKKVYSEKIRFRRLSFVSRDIFEKKRRLTYADDKTLRFLFKIYQAKQSFYAESEESVLRLEKSISMPGITRRRSLFRYPTVVVAKRGSILFDGFLGELHEGQEEEEEEEEKSILLPYANKYNKKSTVMYMPKNATRQSSYIQECFQFLLAIERQPKPEVVWKKILNCSDAQIFYQKNPGSVITLFSRCQLKFSAKTVFQALWEPEIRLKWDTYLQRFDIIESCEQYEVVYIAIRTPSALTKRDLVQKRVKTEDFPGPGGICMHYTSVEHMKCPIKDDYIRAETLVSGYILREVSERVCETTMITKTNIQGILPLGIFSKLASKSPDKWINNLKAGCAMVEALQQRAINHSVDSY